MGKPLSEMTLEELWELFPIILTEHRPEWGEWYREESSRLAKALPAGKFRLSHIGSTAIEGIYAKPIVDILLEIPEDIAMDDVGKSYKTAGICACRRRRNGNPSTGVIRNRALLNGCFICTCAGLETMTSCISAII